MIDRQTDRQLQRAHSFAFYSVQFPARVTAAPTFRVMLSGNTLPAIPTCLGNSTQRTQAQLCLIDWP